MYIEQVLEFCFTVWIKHLKEKSSQSNFVTYWPPRCTLTWDCSRQHLKYPHNRGLSHSWGGVLGASEHCCCPGEPVRSCACQEQLPAFPAFPAWPPLSSVFSWSFSRKRARISSPPSITHLPFVPVPLDMFAACFAALSSQVLVLTGFPMSCLSSCITALLWPLWGYILFTYFIELHYRMLQPYCCWCLFQN